MTMSLPAPRVIIGGVCLIIGGLLGSLSGTWIEGRRNAERGAIAAEAEAARAARSESEMGQLRSRVDLLRIHLRLGRIALQADRQDYGTAAEEATAFFDDLGKMAEQAKGEAKEQAGVQQVLAARDEIIAGLATAEPAAAEKLKQLYLEFFETVD